MKKYISILALLFTITISSCDFVEVPEQEGGIIFNGRKTLIEDYTGHKCTACPSAAREADKLVDKYGDKVVVIGIHAAFFSNFNSAPYLMNYQTPAGTAYDTYFGVSTQGNPNGLINRKDFTPSTIKHVKPFSKWAVEVKKELAKPKTAEIVITNAYNSTTKVLNCSVKSNFLFDTLTGGPYKLIVLITQSDIESPQLDGGTIITNYKHKHVLRDNINGTWGDDLGAIDANSPVTKNYSYTFPATYPAAGGANATACVVADCHIVAFIYNNATKEIIQVEEVKVIP